MSEDPRTSLVGRSGRTYTQWVNDRAFTLAFGSDEATAAMRADKWAFEREFCADDDDTVPVASIINQVTGQPYKLDPPQRVHLDDLDAFLAEHSARFVAEWNEQHPDRRIET